MKIITEICVDSVESAVAAESGGADRIELCDNLLEGGTTPSAGSIGVARELLSIGMHVIIRPRGGDFLYSDIEFETMRRDIDTAKRLGADGVVIGILTADGEVDAERTKRLIDLARPMSVTFHRAFDVVRDPLAALDALITLGAERVLTSGQEASGIEGAELIAELVRRAEDSIIVLGCGGLNERNIARFLSQTGVSEVDLTAFETVPSEMQFRNGRVHMGGALRPPEYERSVANPDIVRRVIGRLGNCDTNQAVS